MDDDSPNHVNEMSQGDKFSDMALPVISMKTSSKDGSSKDRFVAFTLYPFKKSVISFNEKSL